MNYGATPGTRQPGTDFARACLALACTNSHLFAARTAEDRWGPRSPATQALAEGYLGCALTGEQKAAIAAIGATGFSAYSNVTTEFFAAVERQSAVGRLGLRKAPLGVRTILQLGGTTAYWSAEGAPKPVSGMNFETDVLNPDKLVALAIITKELAKSPDPDAEQIVRADLLRANIEALDQAFFDPANAGIPDVMPASVTNAAPNAVGTGDAAADVATAIGLFGGSLERAIFVGSGARFAGMTSAALPDIGARGGAINGIPAVASAGAGENLILLDPDQIAFAGGAVEVQTTEQAALQMADAPGGGAAALVSLWQNNLIGIRVERFVNWKRLRDDAVAYVTAAP